MIFMKTNFFKKNEDGFTLIELLVVVAIISLLSSIVMASLTTARNKAKDAAIKEEMSQLDTLMAFNYNDYGDYCELQPTPVTGFWNNCSLFTGTYAPKAQQICLDLLSKSKSNSLYSGNTTGCTAYSTMVLLNDGNWYCGGSSGKGEYAGYEGNVGCYNNP